MVGRIISGAAAALVASVALAQAPAGTSEVTADGCKLYLPQSEAKGASRIRWSGQCANGFAEGRGVVRIYSGGKISIAAERTFSAGKTASPGESYFVKGGEVIRSRGGDQLQIAASELPTWALELSMLVDERPVRAPPRPAGVPAPSAEKAKDETRKAEEAKKAQAKREAEAERLAEAKKHEAEAKKRQADAKAAADKLAAERAALEAERKRMQAETQKALAEAKSAEQRAAAAEKAAKDAEAKRVQAEKERQAAEAKAAAERAAADDKLAAEKAAQEAERRRLQAERERASAEAKAATERKAADEKLAAQKAALEAERKRAEEDKARAAAEAKAQADKLAADKAAADAARERAEKERAAADAKAAADRAVAAAAAAPATIAAVTPGAPAALSSPVRPASMLSSPGRGFSDGAGIGAAPVRGVVTFKLTAQSGQEYGVATFVAGRDAADLRQNAEALAAVYERVAPLKGKLLSTAELGPTCSGAGYVVEARVTYPSAKNYGWFAGCMGEDLESAAKKMQDLESQMHRDYKAFPTSFWAYQYLIVGYVDEKNFRGRDQYERVAQANMMAPGRVLVLSSPQQWAECNDLVNKDPKLKDKLGCLREAVGKLKTTLGLR